jgi:hypothetical protein
LVDIQRDVLLTVSDHIARLRVATLIFVGNQPSVTGETHFLSSSILISGSAVLELEPLAHLPIFSNVVAWRAHFTLVVHTLSTPLVYFQLNAVGNFDRISFPASEMVEGLTLGILRQDSSPEETFLATVTFSSIFAFVAFTCFTVLSSL